MEQGERRGKPEIYLNQTERSWEILGPKREKLSLDKREKLRDDWTKERRNRDVWTKERKSWVMHKPKREENERCMNQREKKLKDAWTKERRNWEMHEPKREETERCLDQRSPVSYPVSTFSRHLLVVNGVSKEKPSVLATNPSSDPLSCTSRPYGLQTAHDQWSRHFKLSKTLPSA